MFLSQAPRMASQAPTSAGLGDCSAVAARRSVSRGGGQRGVEPRHGLALRRLQCLGDGCHDGTDARAVGDGLKLFLQIGRASACQSRKAGDRIAFSLGAVAEHTGGRAVGALGADEQCVRRAMNRAGHYGKHTGEEDRHARPSGAGQKAGGHEEERCRRFWLDYISKDDDIEPLCMKGRTQRSRSRARPSHRDDATRPSRRKKPRGT